MADMDTQSNLVNASMKSLQTFFRQENSRISRRIKWRIRSAFKFNSEMSFGSENDRKTLWVQTHFNLNRISRFEFALTHLWKFSVLEQIFSPEKEPLKSSCAKSEQPTFASSVHEKLKIWTVSQLGAPAPVPIDFSTRSTVTSPACRATEL